MDAGGDWLSGTERITGYVKLTFLRPEPTLESNKSEKKEEAKGATMAGEPGGPIKSTFYLG